MSPSARQQVKVDGRQLSLSNLEKVLYAEANVSKAEVIEYYAKIADVLVPHLRGRALTLKRYPNGVDSAFFYEKHAPAHRPDWVKTASLWSDSNNAEIDFVLANDRATLVWLANLAAIELHVSLALAKKSTQPTMVVFDLDPGAPANLLTACDVALLLKKELATFELDCWLKTSGQKGAQLYVPLNTPTTYDRTKSFAHDIARRLEQNRPLMITSNMAKSVRAGKVFIDWSQNSEHKTTVAVYSLRATERPQVSAPLKWSEVERAVKQRDSGPLVQDAQSMLKRVAQFGDLFAPLLTTKQKLPKAS